MSLVKRALEMKPTDPMRKRIEAFLVGEDFTDIYSDEYTYIGKSKKLKTDKVIVIKDLGEKCRVKDEFNNISTISKKMLK
ncbi:MAG: hypothetical protein GF317_24555 [Candidatus Lokiarchaeota archaeon]|nr:hypothetical protein [Candidatus Lokiarchaeota archaeon]